jgi:hypothetical protein
MFAIFRSVCWGVLLGFLPVYVVSAKDDRWKDMLEEKLKSQITLTKLGIDHL